MNKCSLCNENLAIIYTTQIDLKLRKSDCGILPIMCKKENFPMIGEIIKKISQTCPFDDIDLDDEDDIQKIDEFYQEALSDAAEMNTMYNLS